MKYEKVKEIKELFKNCNFTLKHCGNCVLWKDEDCIETIKNKVLTLINELESENEWLVGKVKEKINEMTTYTVNNQKFKDRITELEKENEILQGTKNRLTFADRIKLVENAVEIKLNQFAEKLKEKAVDWDCETVDFIEGEIDETLKEFQGE